MSALHPKGQLELRTLAMPEFTNPSGDIFGGWLLSQMDIAGGLTAMRRSQGKVATIAVDAMEFHQPVFVGDVLSCYTRLLRVGTSSMTVDIEAWVQRQATNPELLKVTEGVFTYVAIGHDRQPRPVDQSTSSPAVR